MMSIKETNLYGEVIKEFNYPFADVFLFKGFFVSEIKEGVVFTWDDHAKVIAKDLEKHVKGNGSDLIYISNRINSYSAVASDWLKFFKNNYNLKSYCIVSDKKISMLGSMVENLFFTKKIKRFETIYAAINWTKSGLVEIA